MCEWMDEWMDVSTAFINDGRYLCFCNDIVSSWQEVLTMRRGEWFDSSGVKFNPIVTHLMCLPAPPKK